MLNLFPIQFLALLAYAVLRIIVGFVLLRFGIVHIRHRRELVERFSFRFFPYGNALVWYLGIIEILLAVMFVLGFFTQIAAIVLFFLSLKFMILHRTFRGSLIPDRSFYVLLCAISLSLFITGAGAFAFDLPL